ncbi:hypothetical protein M9Y10_017327 [Tritrichomonas musculus]|uniref:Uncharacterized protein n=1 Tax=Tritrichomonas musculus TaxID=1915356 RepID=A0ABR2HU40_9EUKA
MEVILSWFIQESKLKTHLIHIIPNEDEEPTFPESSTTKGTPKTKNNHDCITIRKQFLNGITNMHKIEFDFLENAKKEKIFSKVIL